MAFAPTVSIVVPAFNRAGLIEETLESLLAQTYRPRPEIIVVDDGSTDETPQILERYGDRVRAIRQENQGPSVARNCGIRAATAELIAFCDSDDLWLPDKLERQIPHFAQEPAPGMLYGGYVCFTEGPDGRREWQVDSPRPSGFIFSTLLEKNFIVPSSVIAPRRVIDDVGGFDPDCCNTEDYDFFLRIALRYPVVYTDAIGCRYRQHRIAASRQFEPYWRGFLRSLTKARLQIAERQRSGALRNPVDGLPVPLRERGIWRALLRRRLASFHVRLANYYLQSGTPRKAWGEVWGALRLTPGDPHTWTTLWKALRHRLGLRRNR